MTKTEEKCRKALLISELVKEYAKPITTCDKKFNISIDYDVKFVKNVCEFFGMKVEQLSNFKKEGERKGYQAFRKEEFNIKAVSKTGEVIEGECETNETIRNLKLYYKDRRG